MHVMVADNTAMAKSTHVSPSLRKKKLAFSTFQSFQKCPFYAAVWFFRSK